MMFWGFVVLSDLVRMLVMLVFLMMVCIGLFVMILVFLDVGLSIMWLVLKILRILCGMVELIIGIVIRFFLVILMFL